MNKSYISQLKSGIIVIFIANMINLLIGIVNGFIMPKYLSVESFAQIKIYQLYSGFLGVLTLGYIDGIYLKYGGKCIRDLTNNDISIFRSNLLASQSIITILMLIFSIYINDKILLFTTFSIIPVNLIAGYKIIFQATAEFKEYSKVLNSYTFFSFIGSLIVLFIFKSDNSIYYIITYVVVAFLIWIPIEYKLRVKYKFNIKFIISFIELKENIKSGIFLMLGNFSSILMTSIDRWFVKVLLDIRSFAYYSFIVSIESLIAIFINPVITTMYNYFCNNSDLVLIKRIRNNCLIFSIFLVSSAFPIKFIINNFLTQYSGSINILFILFSSEILFVLIKGIYINIYKARRQQDVYFKQLIIVIFCGFILNSIFCFINKSNESIAFATLISVYIWFMICENKNKEIKLNLKEKSVLLLSITIFLISGFFFDAIVGFVVYIITITLMCYFWIEDEFKNIFKNILKIIKGTNNS